jgi:hypothetical protein
MLIHGGISEDEEYLSDIQVLSFYPLKWLACQVSLEIDPPKLALHACCLVLPNDQMLNVKLNIYKLPDQIATRRAFNKIKERGVYFFGGRSTQDDTLKNDMWVLRIGKKPLEWIKLKTIGPAPPQRHSHTMNFYEEGNYIIIHGGKNNSLVNGYALDDTYLFELSRFEWIRVILYSDSINNFVFNRCGHSSIIFSIEFLTFSK